MSVTFDTSGWVDFGPHPEIDLPDPVKFNRYVGWEDLSPFCQGYVEAAFASFCEDENDRRAEPGGNPTNRGIAAELDYAFSDLHPATLARFMEDCERALGMGLWGNSAADGRLFWSERQEELFSGFWGGQQTLLAETLFPKLRLHLSPDGKVLVEEVG